VGERADHFLEGLFKRITCEANLCRGVSGPLILDAATGAGNCALAVARMIERGRVITIDNDAKAWTDFAGAKIAKARLLDKVEFHRMDIADLGEFAHSTFDVIVCGATLSAMGVAAVDGIREFARVAKPGAFLAIYDLMPQGAPRTRRQRNAVEAWRLSKAAAVLRGERHYEEFAPEWIARRLCEAGFTVEDTHIEKSWADASDESIREYLDSSDYRGIANAQMRKAFAEASRALKDRVRNEGMSNFSRRFIIHAQRLGRR
jgi:ubiquinone/menaquinone biosynthesis C-methylase UbiE